MKNRFICTEARFCKFRGVGCKVRSGDGESEPAFRNNIRSAEKRMADVAALKTHIINYSKTRDVYAGYRKVGYSKKYLADYEDDIIIHKAAKKAFDELDWKKLPTVKSLNAEYAELLAQKKTAYAEYVEAKKEQRELLIHKTNVEYILDLDEQEKAKEQVRAREREGK